MRSPHDGTPPGHSRSTSVENKLCTLLVLQFTIVLWKITKGGSILWLCVVTDLQAA